MEKEKYTIEWCPFCNAEQIIFADGITICPDCGNLLLPCSMCEECVSNCPYECKQDKHKKIVNRIITRQEVKALRKIMYQ